MDKKTIAGYCAFIVALALIFFIAAELIARNSKGISAFKKSNSWLQTLMVHDIILGWSNRPSSKALVMSAHREVEYVINANGLREKETGYENTSGRRRVLFLGDSCTYGWGVDVNERFSDRLAGKVEGIETINAGVQGYGLDQMLLFLKETGIRYHPDLVVVYLIPDDIKRIFYGKMWNRLKPQYVLEKDGTLRLTNVPVPDMVHPGYWNPFLDRVENFLLRKSYFLWYMRVRLNDQIERHSRVAEIPQDRQALIRAIFGEMHRFCAANGIKLVVIGGVDKDTEGFLKGQGIPYLEDPLDQYPPDKWWLSAYDHHPNAFGHDAIARGIAQYLEKERIFTHAEQ